MKKGKEFKLISILVYFFIILQGSIIGLPFFLWLLFTLFDFGNSDQFFALLAITGLILVYLNINSKKTLIILFTDILCLFLLCSPIIRRMLIIPLEEFNYLVFIIPTAIFCSLYLISIYYSFKLYLKTN